MYEPRQAAPLRHFKRRHATYPSAPLRYGAKWALLGWLAFVPLSFFCTPPRVVPRIFTYFKKALRYPKSKARFWVNAQCAHLVTRKPLNVRMGKGKGAKVRCYSKGKGGAPLAAASSMRVGVERRIRRFVGIRLGCPILVHRPVEAAAPLWVRQWRTQAALLRGRAKELKGLLKLVRRPLTKLFFARLFKIAARRPRLKWRSRWPYAPTRAGALRGRRWRLGAGFRASTVVWAGLASTALGVRRLRRLRLRGPAPLRPLLRALKKLRARRRTPRLRGLGLRPSVLGRAVHALKVAPRPATPGGRGPLMAGPMGVTALTGLWDAGGVRLTLARAALGAPTDQAPVPRLQRVGRFQALAATMLTATLEFVGGRWRVDPSAGLEATEATGGGDLIAAMVRAKRGAVVLTRSPARPLLLAHLSLWPQARWALMAKIRPTARPRALGASKHALFGAYLSTLSLVTTPTARLGGPLSSLHGLNYGPGRAYGRPRPLAWAVGPLWGAWSAWFEALVSVFQAGGQCHVAGAGHLALAGRGLEWATGGHRLSRFRPLPSGRPWGLEASPRAVGHFWLVLRATRGVGEAEPAPEGATFTVGGLNLAPHKGWRSLPGPHGCPHLAAFALSAALVAYQTALLRRQAAAELWGPQL